MTDKSRRIDIPVLTRVEGEGALELSIVDNRISELKLRIFEPPRFFEKFLEGRSYTEVPDIVARICGICPVAYQMSAVQAIEEIFGVVPTEWIMDMRRLMYCGEWIQSHALHIHLLAAPDFLGFENTIVMASEFSEEVRRGMLIQSIGNKIISLLGGRSVHPVGVRVGGFYTAPDLGKVAALYTECESILSECEDLVAWTAEMISEPDIHDVAVVSLWNEEEYPMNAGVIKTSQDDVIDKNHYRDFFEEGQVPHSTSLHSLYKGKPYLVGPLARINHNQKHIPENIAKILKKYNLSFPSIDLNLSIVARAIEIYIAISEAIRLLAAYVEPKAASVDFQPVPGFGYGCTEAPRGLLWHKYEVDEKGKIAFCEIVPPTSQNQACIEENLKNSLTRFGLEKSDVLLKARGERIIRNYDPCISCSTHFLQLKTIRQ